MNLRAAKPDYEAVTLFEAAPFFKRDEIACHPELPTLAALDTTVEATCKILEVEFAYPGDPQSRVEDGSPWAEEFIVDTIYTLAKALQNSLYAYYAAVKARDKAETDADKVMSPIPF